jgi:hypothetical protein
MHAVERLSESALHRMSQPLTAMRCLLEYGLEQDEPHVLRDFAQRSMKECVRLSAMVHVFRALVQMGMRSQKTEEIALLDLLPMLPMMPVLPETQWTGPAGESGAVAGEVTILANRSGLESAMWHLSGALNVGGVSAGGSQREGSIEITGDKVCLRWKMTGNSSNGSSNGSDGIAGADTAWANEQETVDPFAVVDYDFVRKGIPRLTIVRTIAEAMGGNLLCTSTSLELQLQRGSGVKEPAYSAASNTANGASSSAAKHGQRSEVHCTVQQPSESRV